MSARDRAAAQVTAPRRFPRGRAWLLALALFGGACAGPRQGEDLSAPAAGRSGSLPEDAVRTEYGLDEFDRLWNFGDPVKTRAAFQSLIPQAEANGDPAITASLYSQIARTHSLVREFPLAHEWLDRAEAIAPDGDDVARVRIALERGRTYNASGVTAKAVEQFQNAEAMASRLVAAGDLPAEYHWIDALHMLGIADDPERAIEWSERAIAAAESAQTARARRWLAPLYNNLGWTYHDLGRYEEALGVFERALAAHIQFGTPNSIRIAKWAVARTYRSLGRIEEALAEQQLLYAEYARSEEGRNPYVCEELAECLWTLGRRDEAARYYREALPGLEAQSAYVEAERIERARERGR